MTSRITFPKFKLYEIICAFCIENTLTSCSSENRSAGYNTTNFKMGDRVYTFLVADTETKRAKGLMFVNSLPNHIDGMIFYHPVKEIQSFWNKNTYINLDVFWFNDNQFVGRTFLPSILQTGTIVRINSPHKVNIVVERKTLD